MKSLNSTLRNTIYVTTGAYIEYFLGMIISIIVARHLGPSDYGIYSLLIWMSALLIILSNAGYTTGVIKYIAEVRGESGEDSSRINTVLGYFRNRQLLAMALFLVIAAISIPILGERIIGSEYNGLLWLILIAGLLKANYMFYISVAKGMEIFKLVALANIIVSPANLILVLIAIAMGGGLEKIVMTYLLASAIYILTIKILLAGKIKYKSNNNLDSDLKSRMGRHALYTAIIVILSFVALRQSELIFLNYFSTKEDVGYFNIAFSLAKSAAFLVPGVYSSVLLPLMSRSISQGKQVMRVKYIAATRYLVLLAMPLAAFGVVMSEDIITILYGADYINAAIPFAVILLFTSFSAVSTAATSYQVSADRQHVVLKIIIFATVLNLVADYFLIKEFKLTGAVIGYSVTSLLVAIALIVNTTKELKAPLEHWIYFKTLIAVILSVIPLFLVKLYLSGILLIITGLIIFSIIFLLISIIFSCWSEQDVELFIRAEKKVFKKSYIVINLKRYYK